MLFFGGPGTFFVKLPVFLFVFVFCCLMNKLRALNAKTTREVLSVFRSLSGSSRRLRLFRPETEAKINQHFRSFKRWSEIRGDRSR